MIVYIIGKLKHCG